jgi:hypothetical protein
VQQFLQGTSMALITSARVMLVGGRESW